MTATDMKLAGLEVGCKVDVLPLHQIGGSFSASEARRLTELNLHNPWRLIEINDSRSLVHISIGNDDARQVPVHRDDIVRNYEDAQKARHQRFYALVDNHYPHHIDNATESDTIERYCGIQQNGHDGEFYSYLADSFDDVAAMLADDIFQDWMPEYIYDLDTGKQIELHISSPVITRAEDQGVMVNVLEGLEV